MKDSKVDTLSTRDWAKWRRNLIVFLIPPALIYLTTISGILSIDGHEFTVRDLYPSRLTQGAMLSYLISSLIDLLKKYKEGTK